MIGLSRNKRITWGTRGFALGLALVIASSATIAAAQDAPAAAATSEKRVRLAMLPMVVHSNERPEFLRNGLVQIGVQSFWIEVATGVLLLVAVGADQVRIRLTKSQN